jgi:CspA family cold shock protein
MNVVGFINRKFFNGESVVMSESESESGILKGVVKWFNDAKGFGFIQHTSGRDVFVHYSVISSDGFKTLKDGETVEYELKEGPKGLQASKVVRTKKEDNSSEGAIDTETDEASASLTESESAE